ncbi:hypothetical protein FM042_05085 [Aliidiomarina halalkaliphila]|uniref:HPt domain-containing protein n=1 Tax=Aliidiomarina halalkaliphila TaxID=2593535 RepID=A0A552X5B2_9GAMM|nr:Hpt domain-containing protein [Aliidiomarina halalkaliphila]TRW50212.1 hypothetical protein FM042_05085 [Aliidiomarina halalkaliphila]
MTGTKNKEIHRVLCALVADFENDSDFVSDFLLTVKTETSEYASRTELLIDHHNKISITEVKRIAHLLKSAAGTLHLDADSITANSLEQEFAELEHSMQDISASQLQRLRSTILKVHATASNMLMELESW